MRRTVLAAFAAIAGLPLQDPAVAQPRYPERPVRIVVGYPPGGATDLLARIAASGLSARLGHCAQELPGRVIAHLRACGLPARLPDLPRRFSAAALLARMAKDKKARDGSLRFVLIRRPGDAFTASDVPREVVEALLRDEGCEA